MITIRKAEDRFHTEIGWLDSHHTFSFGEHQDPAHMGFRALRVINEDRVAPGQGFPTHAHRDMEILSYVLAGALEHRDSMGNGSVIRPGDLQRMTAGTGVRHSEQNGSSSETTHFLQIWILPARPGIAPGYEQRSFPEAERRGRLRLIGSSDGRDGSVTIHQDVALWVGLLGTGQRVTHPLVAGRHAWIQVTRGALQVGDTELRAGDGASISQASEVALEALSDSEALLFDLT